jgi:hypothetical protein
MLGGVKPGGALPPGTKTASFEHVRVMLLAGLALSYGESSILI